MPLIGHSTLGGRACGLGRVAPLVRAHEVRKAERAKHSVEIGLVGYAEAVRDLRVCLDGAVRLRVEAAARPWHVYPSVRRDNRRHDRMEQALLVGLHTGVDEHVRHAQAEAHPAGDGLVVARVHGYEGERPALDAAHTDD